MGIIEKTRINRKLGAIYINPYIVSFLFFNRKPSFGFLKEAAALKREAALENYMLV